MNQQRYHALYNEGDFEQAISALETFRKAHPVHSHSDSVFIAKHLAVMYSANPVTREKGKHYMVRLLELVPGARLVDMYVSDEIDRIFEKVKEEFQDRRTAFTADSARPPSLRPQLPAARDTGAPPAVAHAGSPKKRGRAAYWLAGGGIVAAAAAGVTAYYFFEPARTPKDTVYVLGEGPR